MIENQNLFVKMETDVHSQICLRDGTLQQAVGKGAIAIYSEEGTRNIIFDILYVPNLTQNLLSVGQLMERLHCSF